MSEKEIRELLHTLCADIDRRAKRTARTLKKAAIPFAIGAGLALGAGGCSDDATSPPKVDKGAQYDGIQPAYMAPPFEMGPAPAYAVPGVDSGPAPEYAAPGPDAGPQPDYMAPDAGPQPDYMAPGPDGGK